MDRNRNIPHFHINFATTSHNIYYVNLKAV